MDKWRQQYPVAVMCRVFEVSESGYHAWRDRPPSRRAQENARLEVEIRAAHQRTRETCGPERLQSDLADHGIRAGVNRIKRIRKKLGLRCKQKRKFKVTTDSKHHLPIAPNLLDRNFTVPAPNRAWVSAITYIPTDEGWLYLAGLKESRSSTTGNGNRLALATCLPQPSRSDTMQNNSLLNPLDSTVANRPQILSEPK
jgi:putative transposase